MLMAAGCADFAIPAVYFTDKAELAELITRTTKMVNERLACKAFISGHDSDYTPYARSVNVTIALDDSDDRNYPWGVYDEFNEVIKLRPTYKSDKARFMILLHEMAHSVGVQHVKEAGKLMSERLPSAMLLRPDGEIADAFVESLGHLNPCPK